ncbi:hypothetical protein D0T49_06110 [Paludibacter sp. 221]|uniref:helix-turn-helix and ligand-binding sensor domain-containing protein n=1 Tax=Paludibacter sp. 221 TaxID=2302939 RepID=UPI0013D648E7|nr:two-component regulator propeller domain-containing protein [Paludibacter sp. 221]NDV46617.1 hypothetical protein [Paludibacter sp. 221]
MSLITIRDIAFTLYKKQKINLLLLCSIFPTLILAQDGIPLVVNIDKNDYATSSQNRDITFDSQNLLYAANSSGLLEYNGSSWQLYSLPANTPVNSVLAGKNDRIYIGSFEEFGFFERNEYGKLQYTSLSNGIKFDNEYVEKIVAIGEKTYFLSSNSLFEYDNSTVKPFATPFTISSAQNINEELYCFSKGKGVSVFRNNKFETVISTSQLANDIPVFIFNYTPNSFLVLTKKNGLFFFDGKKCTKWETPINALLKSGNANNGTFISDSLFVVATNNRGIYIFDRKGKVKTEINASNGLQSNTVHCVYPDKTGNMWAAMDNGISQIQNNSDIRFIKPFKSNIGSIFSALFHNNHLYVATNQGVFYSKTEGQNFEVYPIPMLEGQANSLNIFDNQLICNHSNGTYLIDGEKATLLSDIKDATIIQRVLIHQKEVLLQCASKHLNVYKKNASGNWTFSHSIDDFLYPIRQMEVDIQGNIWVSHYYKGLFRIKLNHELTATERVDHYSAFNAQNEGKAINLFKIKGRIVFGDNKRYYTHDDINNVIIPYNLLNEQLSQINDIKKVSGIDDDVYWCITEKGFSKIYISDDRIELRRSIPFSYFNYDLPDQNKNIINSNENIIFCLNNGIAFLKERKSKNELNYIPELKIASVLSISNSDTTYLEISRNKKETIPYTSNNITFNVRYNYYDKGIQYIYKLEGLDNDFSTPTLSPQKEYNRLHTGKYTFHAIACDYLGNPLSSASYSFDIARPAYLNITAIMLYTVILIILLAIAFYLLRKYIRKSNLRIAKEQERLRREENEQKEKEIIKLRNNNLQSELYFKSKEMANSTFMLINKNNILIEIKNELTEQKEKLGNQYPSKYYNKIVSLIDSAVNLEDNWNVFQANFDRIHENFFRNLKTQFPELTSTDLKICALLRLNLSTKDIANFLGNTIRGVDSARYRLRKKLNIASNVDIVEFLIQFKGEE